MNRRSRSSVVSFLVALVFAVHAHAALSTSTPDEVARVRSFAARKSEAAKALSVLDLVPLDACTPKPISSPASISGSISTASCYDAVINGYEDIYNLPGVAGQTITIELSSTSFNVFLWMEGAPVDIISFLSSGVSRQRIVYTFPTTKTYKLEAETLYGPGDGQPYTGPYTLLVTGGGACTPSSTTMCLNNERFAVSATYNTGSSNGTASAVKLTSDSGYLTFFNASNVEVVIKVLDACGLNSRYWVFAGGLTNVNTVITVRDTKTGTVRTYTNPANTPFQAIQDTAALPVCP